MPWPAGLTEAEQGEAVKAAEALREQQGGSDDDGDDYRQASKVGQRGRFCLTTQSGSEGG